MTIAKGAIAAGTLMLPILLTGGCASKIDLPANEFVARYTANIDVPNPDGDSLPARKFLGDRKGLYLIADSIPSGQGGGFLGKRIIWQCPVGDLPRDFPDAYRPGDAIFDGRRGSGHAYMIESYAPPMGHADPPRSPPTVPAEPSPGRAVNPAPDPE